MEAWLRPLHSGTGEMPEDIMQSSFRFALHCQKDLEADEIFNGSLSVRQEVPTDLVT